VEVSGTCLGNGSTGGSSKREESGDKGDGDLEMCVVAICRCSAGGRRYARLEFHASIFSWSADQRYHIGMLKSQKNLTVGCQVFPENGSRKRPTRGTLLVKSERMASRRSLSHACGTPLSTRYPNQSGNCDGPLPLCIDNQESKQGHPDMKPIQRLGNPFSGRVLKDVFSGKSE